MPAPNPSSSGASQVQSDGPVLQGRDAGGVEARGDPVGEQAQPAADELRDER